MKLLKWLGFSAAGLVLLLVTLLVVLSFVYDKAIVKYLKKNLNEYLLTEIIVEDIDFSMIRKFPYATVEFSNVLIRSKAGLHHADFKTGDQDTLLSSSRIYFQFGLFGLIRNEYRLKGVHLLNGKINLLTDKAGRNNFSIWKSPAEESTEKANDEYRIDFNNVVISSFDLKYTDRSKSIAVSSYINKSVFSGSFSADSGLYALKSDWLLRQAVIHEKSVAGNMPLYFDFKASSKQNELTLRQSKITLNKMPVHLSGHIQMDSSLLCDLTVTSADFGLDEILSLLTRNEKSRLHDFTAEGKGKINLSLQGSLAAGHFPRIQADFSLSGGSLANKNTRSKLSAVDIKGTLSGNRPSDYILTIGKFDARLSTGRISGKARLANLDHPEFAAEIYSTINLNNLNNLIDLDTVEYLSGTLETRLKAAGSFSGKEGFSVAGFLSGIQSGYLEFDDGRVKIKGLPYVFQDINGKILIDKSISFQHLAMNVNQTALLLTGNLDGLFNYLFDRKSVISSNLYLYSRFIDGNGLLSPSGSSGPSGQHASGVNLPDFLKIRAKINADEFQVGKFKATNLKCELGYEPEIIDINKFTFNYIDGTISGNSLIQQETDSCLLVSCTADLKYIDIQQLFTSFNNFSQQFILDENLKGKMGGKATFIACWDNHLNFVPAGLTAQADLEIINGELLKFDPMLSLSRYINVEELRHIKFKTLKNNIFIFDRQIWIPEMLIHSSAFNIALSGTHSFDNDFDYRLRVALSDVLFKKARRKKQEIEDYLIMEEDAAKTVIPISIIGNPDDFKVAFDSKKAFDLIRDNLQEQGMEMKGVFDRKSMPSPEKPAGVKGQPAVEWEEEQNKTPLPKEKKARQTGDEIQIKWEEKDSSDFEFFH